MWYLECMLCVSMQKRAQNNHKNKTCNKCWAPASMQLTGQLREPIGCFFFLLVLSCSAVWYRCTHERREARSPVAETTDQTKEIGNSLFFVVFFFFLLSTGEINKWHKPFIIEKKQTFLTAVVFFFFFFFHSTLHLWTYILVNCSYYMLLKLHFYYRIISVSLYGMAFGVYFVSEKPAGWWLSSALFTFLRRCAWCLKVYIHCVIASHESECDRSRHAYVFCPVHFRIISVAIGELLTDSI